MATENAANAGRESDVDTGHEYDGIREYDNRLPNWWLAILFISTVFGYGYFFYYHVFDRPGLWETYKADALAANSRSLGPIDDKIIMDMSAKAATEGAPIFKTTCAPCHGENGEGKIGPNLTDKFWLHGGKPTDIYNTISKGVVQKGMPAWTPVLGDAKVRLLAAYVSGSVKGKNIPNPAKPAEGTPEP